MIGRRHVLRVLLGGLGTLASCRTAPTGTSGETTALDPDASPAATAWKRRFLRDFRRTSSRTYSEEGIPVFLVGEDRAGSEDSAGALPPAPGRTSADAARLAADLRRGASVLAEARLARTEEDLGKLVEVLAERDFGVARIPPRS